MKKYLGLFISVILALGAIYIYSGFWGNPVDYIISKKIFEEYKDKYYKDKIEIESISWNFKTNCFSATVVDLDNSLEKAYFTIDKDKTVNDSYYFYTIVNMSDEISRYIGYNIEKQTDLIRENLSIDSYIEIEQYKYGISDPYSGEEPIELSINIHEVYDFDKNENKSYDNSRFPYKNEKAFLTDAYKIVEVLKALNYDFYSVKIDSYKEDGNNAYGVDIENLDDIKSIEDLTVENIAPEK